MVNELFLLIRQSKLTLEQVAARAGVSRTRISQLIGPDPLPRNVRLNTLDRIAGGLGYTVEVNFVPKDAK